MHPVAPPPQSPGVAPVDGTLVGHVPESSMSVGWTVAGGGAPGRSEGEGTVLGALGAQVGGVLGLQAHQVVVVVPGVLLVRGVLGSAAILEARGGRGLAGQAALVLVVHEGLLVGSGHGADHLLLPAVRRTEGGRAGTGVHRHGWFGVRAGVGLAGAR